MIKKGDRTLLKGDFGDNNEYIINVVSYTICGNVTIRTKYKSNLAWDESIKNVKKNYERWYNVISYEEYICMISGGTYDAKTYKETLQ